jgi:hypothetical protein
MKVYTYWENPIGRTMPPYVALCIATMQHCMGDRFELLTPESIAGLGHKALQKRWEFQPLPFAHEAAHLSIVAKSDYVRLAWIARHGGIWIDADMIVTAPLDDLLIAASQSGKLLWSSEAFFGAQAGCAILCEASHAALASPTQAWGNPGGVRDLIEARSEEVIKLAPRLLDPGAEPPYCFQTCEIMLSKILPVDSFLTNLDLRVLKLYNTYFSRSALNTSLDSFLDSGTLLARLFLKIHPDRSFWFDIAGKIISEAENLELTEPA